MFSLKYGKRNLLIINIFNNLKSQICVPQICLLKCMQPIKHCIFKKKKKNKDIFKLAKSKNYFPHVRLQKVIGVYSLLTRMKILKGEGDFPGGPVVRTLHFSCSGVG